MKRPLSSTTFLAPIILLTSVLQVNCKSHSTQHIPIAQGFTTDSQAQFAIVKPKNTKYNYWIMEQPPIKSLVRKETQRKEQLDRKAMLQKASGLLYQIETSEEGVGSKISSKKLKAKAQKAKVTQTFKRNFSNWAIDHILASSLKLKKYFLIVTDKSKTCDNIKNKKLCFKKRVVVDIRSFKTLDVNKKAFTMMVASCMNERRYPKMQENFWESAFKQRPDVIALIGDNLYADRYFPVRKAADPKTLWERYMTSRQRTKLFTHHILTPIWAIWDDHDYGINNGDMTYPHKKAALKVFKAFWAQNEMKPYYTNAPRGSGFMVKAFQQRLFFMDNRFLRTPNAQSKRKQALLSKLKAQNPNYYETQWGKQNERWLFNYLNQEALPSWIVNGGQVFGGYHPWESYERSHSKNFYTVLIPKLSKTLSPVVFMSGDRHLFELMKIEDLLPYTTYEVTISGAYTRMYPSSWDIMPSPRQVFGKTLVPNYVLVQSTKKGSALQVQLEAWNVDNHTMFYRNQLQIKK